MKADTVVLIFIAWVSILAVGAAGALGDVSRMRIWRRRARNSLNVR